ncbi:hypothetical protein DDE18_01920 [Nocardioides gansuensis]|uniref:AbiEi antitoxin N-terminal domain-containing protein n=1 Tax=Nocardioides gansuensis TaxID=2138300 RepID=A0A2T8FFC2_9ACTN|nr:type IV toxin-antitoxin system AbiEi family antitoxin domain-containing protein [Nocardioides gansuensis]PVG84399.1 hypothetical protein DDE18_01920 [Nocardioides gansuensis]
MDARVRAAIAEGGELVTTRRLRELGIDPRLVAAAVRRGELVAVRRGIYTSAALWASWDEFRLRPIARIKAADLAITVPHVFSHDSSALLQELPLIDARRADVHITRERVLGSRTKFGIRHHGAPYDAADVCEIHGLQVLSIPRTVIDIAREHGYDAGLVAADGALRLGCTQAQLLAQLEVKTHWPGITVARAVVEDADIGAENAAETLARILVRELGVGAVETQFPVVTRRGVRWCDLRVGCHVFEFHGRLKVLAPEAGGVAEAAAAQVLWDERKRERDVTSPGLGLSNIYWEDFFEPARARAIKRLAEEYAVTRRRFGDVLPALLEEQARRLRGRRYPRFG